MSELIRINKYLSDCGICSRRKADKDILSGMVFVNKIKVKMGTKIDPDQDEVIYKGQIINIKNDKVYYALYKPRGIISSSSDELGRKNVIDLVPASPKVYPVGRLDKYSEGLIILTNDGNLTNNLTHPKNMHEKEYEVRARTKNKNIDTDKIENLLINGFRINKILMKADRAKAITVPNSDNIVIKLVLHTGYNRQIRKMCDKIGLDIVKLKRIRIGKLLLSDLDIESGEYITIKNSQII